MKITPHADVRTGKIYGVEKGTWKYYHEEGHLKFNSLPKTSNLLLMQDYALTLWMLTITLSLAYKALIPFVGIFWAIHFGIMIYEEYWCNKYAYSKTGGKK
jgi:hypothetical protein